MNTFEFKGEKIFFENCLKNFAEASKKYSAKKFFSENIEIADAIYGTDYKSNCERELL